MEDATSTGYIKSSRDVGLAVVNVSDLEKKVTELSASLSKALPNDINGDGCFGTDGSFQQMFHLYEKAFLRASNIADEALFILEEMSNGPQEKTTS